MLLIIRLQGYRKDYYDLQYDADTLNDRFR